jgi:hypothetical protein
MKRKQKRTNIQGALIFVALVAIFGFILVATGNLRNPLNFFAGGIDHQGGPGVPVSQVANNNAGRGRGFAGNRVGRGQGFAGNRAGRGQGFAGDHAGPGRGPDAEDNGGIAWNQIGSVFSDLWILFAIVACYILVQQTLGLITNRFWAWKDPQLTT